MSGPQLLLITIIFTPVLIMVWNKVRCKGKMLCFVLRKDKSVVGKLCALRSAFVIYEDRAYDIYPDLVRLFRFPMGWPAILQEIVPIALYDEENAVPLDWITLEPFKDGSLSLRAALDENWLKKLVHETAMEGVAGGGLNWKKILPFALIGLGVAGLIFMLIMRARSGG